MSHMIPLMQDHKDERDSLDESIIASSEASFTREVQDMFADEEVSTRKKPIKGYRFCIFTIFMIVALSVYILLFDQKMRMVDITKIDLTGGSGNTTQPETPAMNTTTVPADSTSTNTTTGGSSGTATET